MSELKARMQNDLKEAMKAGNAHKRDVLRQLTSALKQVEIDNRKDLTDDDVINIVKKEIKRRQESIVDLEKAGRDIAGEQAEIDVMNIYLPAQMDAAQIETLVKEAIAESGAQSAKDMGNVMKVLMPRLKGQADGKTVNEIVRKLLS